MDILIFSQPFERRLIEETAKKTFGEFVKAVVDLSKKKIAIGGELHADEELMLLKQGSQQQDLWGINIYPGRPLETWIEFDSMINLRPSQGNRSRGVDDPAIQKQIHDVVEQLIQ